MTEKYFVPIFSVLLNKYSKECFFLFQSSIDTIDYNFLFFVNKRSLVREDLFKPDDALALVLILLSFFLIARIVDSFLLNFLQREIRFQLVNNSQLFF